MIKRENIVTVTLTAVEVRRAMYLAVDRTMVRFAEGWRERLTEEMLSAIGEMACAKALGVYWQGPLDHQGLIVRMSDKAGSPLTVTAEDTKPVIMVSATELHNKTIRIIGWVDPKSLNLANGPVVLDPSKQADNQYFRPLADLAKTLRSKGVK